MGVEPVYKMFEHDGVRGTNMATVRSPPAQPAKGWEACASAGV